jgi:adenylate kinase
LGPFKSAARAADEIPYLFFGAPGAAKVRKGKILRHYPRFFTLRAAMSFVLSILELHSARHFSPFAAGNWSPMISLFSFGRRIADHVGAHIFKPTSDSLVLDGIPRNVGQARIMEIIDVKQVFHLACRDRSALVSRLRKRALKDNRFDDASEDVIRRRLQTYEEESKPVLEFYGPGLIREVDATQTPLKVAYDLLTAVVQQEGR